MLNNFPHNVLFFLRVKRNDRVLRILNNFQPLNRQHNIFNALYVKSTHKI